MKLVLLSAALVALSACSPGSSSTDSTPPADEGSGGGEGTGDEGSGSSRPDTGIESVPGDGTPDDEDDDGGGGDDTWPKACSDLYDPDELQVIEFDFETSDWQALQNDCSAYNLEYHPVSVTWNGEQVDAHVRLKGNWSWSCDKLQFVLSFHEDDSDNRFHGLRKTILDAPWYDHTFLHERLAFSVFEDRGLPYSCANNAKVLINGEYYGIYSNLERLDREYLERHFEDPDGNLYQAGSELKTNEDEGDTSRLSELQGAEGSVEELEALMNLELSVAHWATEAMIPALDNYWAGVEINYYLYDDPVSGFVTLPYDLDISFGDSAYSDGTLIWPSAVSADPISYEHTGWKKERLVKTVLADPVWCSRFVEELEEARATYDPDLMRARLADWDEQIREAVADDPNKTFSTSRNRSAVDQLDAFFEDRADFVDAWLAEGGHCPGG